ncbi:hypothetical protein ABW20_dc0104795 [Dactylellina cionopaga]|nr:hypothetical protein ABW20_dc0104795 [Dactylellina cionopaga]
MSGFEVAGLILGAAGLVPLFEKGYKMVRDYRKKKAAKNPTGANGASSLALSLQNSKSTLEDRYNGFYLSLGKAFATGDATSRDKLKDITILLQQELINVLQMALASGILNTSNLSTITANGRDDALTTLSELAQRLTSSKPLTNSVRPTKPKAGSRITEIKDDDDAPPDQQVAHVYPYPQPASGPLPSQYYPPPQQSGYHPPPQQSGYHPPPSQLAYYPPLPQPYHQSPPQSSYYPPSTQSQYYPPASKSYGSPKASGSSAEQTWVVLSN